MLLFPFLWMRINCLLIWRIWECFEEAIVDLQWFFVVGLEAMFKMDLEAADDEKVELRPIE